MCGGMKSTPLVSALSPPPAQSALLTGQAPPLTQLLPTPIACHRLLLVLALFARLGDILLTAQSCIRSPCSSANCLSRCPSSLLDAGGRLRPESCPASVSLYDTDVRPACSKTFPHTSCQSSMHCPQYGRAMYAPPRYSTLSSRPLRRSPRAPRVLLSRPLARHARYVHTSIYRPQTAAACPHPPSSDTATAVPEGWRRRR